MAKAPKRETEDNVSRETEAVATAAALAEFPRFIQEQHPKTCARCHFWRREANGIFGGCGKTGTTTTHYGETRYVHYTPDGASCSAFEPKE